MSILVIGETCKDVFIYGESSRLCPEAPAPVFIPKKTIFNSGMASNVYNNIVSLGHSCEILTNSNWEQVTKTRLIHRETNQMFIRIDENDHIVNPCSLENVEWDKYEVIVISDYDKGFLSVDHIVEISEKHPCVFLDTKKTLGKWCEKIKFVKINSYEYERTKLFMSSDLEDKLIVTLGSKGCRHKEKRYRVDNVEIKDVSGAGDTFLAGLPVKYAQTKEISDAIIFANQCATKVVQKRGVNVV